MKHTLSLITTSLILGGIAVYCGLLMSQGSMNVAPELLGKEMITFAIVVLLCATIWYYSTLGVHHIQKPKITLGVMGVILIMYGSYAIVDVAGSGIFLSDIMRISGVYVLIASLTGFIGSIDNKEKTTTGSSVNRIKNAEVIEI